MTTPLTALRHSPDLRPESRKCSSSHKGHCPLVRSCMIALDTNVLIYACDKADPARQQIALDLISNTTDAVILWQVASEFIAASRKLDRQGFTAADAWARLSEFLGVCPLVMPRS